MDELLRDQLDALKRGGIITEYNLPPFTKPYNGQYDFGLTVPRRRGETGSLTYFAYAEIREFRNAVTLLERVSFQFLGESNL